MVEKMLEAQVKSTVEFHAQDKFKRIMQIARVRFYDIIRSLDVNKNVGQVFKAGQGAGMSGQFFFFTSDNKFIIKTILEEEKQFFLENLDNFITHFEKVRNESLIVKILGLYTIRTDQFVPVNLILMENIIQVKDKKNSKVVFDVKGSSFRRYVKLQPTKQNDQNQDAENKFWRNKLHYKEVLKDMNFVEIEKDIGENLLQLNLATSDMLLR